MNWTELNWTTKINTFDLDNLLIGSLLISLEDKW